ncbi:type II secretion system protein GspD [Nautilia sp.]
MKKIIFFLLILINSLLFAYDLKQADFATFCNYVSYHTNYNIVVSEEVPTNFSVFMPRDDMKKNDILTSFFTILQSKKLNYKIINNSTILIYKKLPLKHSLKLENFVIRFNYVPKKVLSDYLKNFYPSYKFQIFQNRLLITCTPVDYYKIRTAVNMFQSSYKKAKINFLITVINNKKAKEIGSELNVKSPFHSSLLFDFVTDTASVSSSAVFDFSSFIKFLNSKGAAETISKPTILLIDSNNYTLESVHSIPYITKSVTTDKDGNPVTQTDLKYKDIGLKIYIKNVYITDESIDFDMDIYLQSIVSYDDDKPITDTKHFNTHIQLTKKSDNYLIAGLRTVTKIDEESGVPVLKDVPVIGILFQKNKKSVEDLSFSFYISTDYFKRK